VTVECLNLGAPEVLERELRAREFAPIWWAGVSRVHVVPNMGHGDTLCGIRDVVADEGGHGGRHNETVWQVPRPATLCRFCWSAVEREPRRRAVAA
jgi:hypothetical protein